MPYKILERLKINGEVSLLPSGYHSSVILVAQNGFKQVIKVISKRELNSIKVADQLARDIQAYSNLLQKIGLPTPDVKVELISNGSIWDIVVISPFCGHDISNDISDGSESLCLESIDKILLPMGLIFKQQLELDDFELQIGIDPKPSNFTLDENGAIYYVDLMPPRYRRDGVALVEFPPPVSKNAEALAYFRHYDMRGLLFVLQTQLCRLRFDLRPQILEKLWLFSEQFCSGRLSHYLKQIPSSRFISALPKNREEIISLIRRDDMYEMRDIALQLAFENMDLYSLKEIESIFQLSHFFDNTPSTENVERIKALLLAMNRQESTKELLGQ